MLFVLWATTYFVSSISSSLRASIPLASSSTTSVSAVASTTYFAALSFFRFHWPDIYNYNYFVVSNRIDLPTDENYSSVASWASSFRHTFLYGSKQLANFHVENNSFSQSTNSTNDGMDSSRPVSSIIIIAVVIAAIIVLLLIFGALTKTCLRPVNNRKLYIEPEVHHPTYPYS